MDRTRCSPVLAAIPISSVARGAGSAFRGVAAQAGDARMATAVQRYGENLRPAMDRLREMSVPRQASAPGEERPARLG